ncbi:MAG TPA: glycosyltransferase [Ensifer sp.]|nr:glycosyltransferase [Ensifer sp.]
MPTYNGAEFIGECLASLRDQSFEDFEVFISDNGSTDGTSDICADFARTDKRFRHVFYPETVPATENFIRARDMTSAPYFCWRADDDLADREHLAGLVSALDGNPQAVLAVSPVLRITESAERLFELPSSIANDRVGRIRDILIGCHPSWFYGLWRREATDSALGGFANYEFAWAADHLAMLPAILDNAVALSPEGRFIQRIKRQANYHLPPDKLLQARKQYRQLALEMIAEREWSPAELKIIRRALELHLERRVAPWFKTHKRAIKHKLRSALPFG